MLQANTPAPNPAFDLSDQRAALEKSHQILAVLSGWLTLPVEGDGGLHLSHRDQTGVEYLLSDLDAQLKKLESLPT